jgi:hypothetical protein
MFGRSITLSLLFAALGIVSPAYGDVIFNNFGPGDSYNPTTGQAIGGTTNQDIGDRFDAIGASYTLDRVVLPLGFINGVNALDVSFMTSVGGVPGTVIETWHVTNLPPFFQNNPPLVLDSVLHPLLAEGQPYYVAAFAPAGAGTNASWAVNSIGARGPLAIGHNGGGWFVIEDFLGEGALRVEGTPAVPEPDALALFSLGALAFAGYAWRSKFRLGNSTSR